MSRAAEFRDPETGAHIQRMAHYSALVARQMGMQTLGISLITNAAAGVEEGEINHAEVMEMGQRVSGQFGQLLSKIIARM